MSKSETTEPTSTAIMVRAFIVAFFLPVLYTSTSANFVQWHVSIIILFASFYLAFRLLKTFDRMLTFTTIFIIVVAALVFVGVEVANSYPQSAYGPVYSFAIGLLAIIGAFAWPKNLGTDSDRAYEEGDDVLLVIGKSEPDPIDHKIRELTTRAVVVKVDEVRVKLRHRDQHGNTVESWNPLDAIRPIEDI